MEESYSSIVLESSHLNITLESTSLSVLSIPNEFVPKCAWWILREYGSSSLMNTRSFHSLLSDDDGLSIVCSAQMIQTIEFLMTPAEYTLSTRNWRAFVINLSGSAYELPGMVYCLANSLSQEGLSILHISTFESEVFLVQEPDLDTACAILRQFEDPLQIMKVIDKAWQQSEPKPISSSSSNQMMNNLPTTSSSNNITNGERESNLNDTNEFDESWLTPQVSTVDDMVTTLRIFPPATPRFAHGFTLCVLPNPVILAKLRDISHWPICAPILMNLLLYDERYSPLEKRLRSSHNSRRQSKDSVEPMTKNDYNDVNNRSTDIDTLRAQYMWGLWHHSHEITFLLDEKDVSLFPKDMLVTSPQQWRVIKLCGRPIAFNETGVVSAMSKVDASIPSLNISTVSTNCTLVPEELLETSAQKLSSALGCPWKYVSLL